MEWLLDIPLALRLALVFAAGAFVAGLLNAAIYAWSWERRLVSPWQKAPNGVGPRTWVDRLPIAGWLRLRRNEAVVGRGFWIRPLGIELFFALAMAALYWWEVDQLGLIAAQLAEQGRLALAPLPPLDPTSIAGSLHGQFAAHALLAALMTIATFIDFDERIIPDEVTFTGTLAGLVIAAWLPLAMLPSITERPVAPPAGVLLMGQGGAPMVGNGGGRLYLEPVHLAAPNPWPAAFGGPPARGSFVIGLGCFWLWLFALTDRRWPRAGGPWKRLGAKLRLVLARIRRDLTSRPLRETLVAGTLLIAMTWFGGGGHWTGLLSSLVGLAVSGGLVWAVRVIGSAVLGREAMGFGDVTLMMMIGTLTGWQAAPIIFFAAPLAGLLLALVNLLLHGDKAIPYGPFLCLATAAVVVCWGEVWVWGGRLFGVWWLVPTVLIVGFVLLAVLLGLLQLLKALLGVAGND